MILRPWVVLLAAGGARRYGSAKQLARIGGQTLLRRAALAALGSGPAGCIVVLGARATRLVRELRGLPVRAVINRQWRAGLAGSLRTGMAALPPDAPGVLVLLADQPGIGSADLALLIGAWRLRPRAIVTARTAEARCPPALFPRHAFAALRRLRGDAGARELLRDPGRQVVDFDMPQAAFDVDDPGDLAACATPAPRRVARRWIR